MCGNGDQCGRIGVTQFYADLFIFQISQNIQKIGDVESDIDTVTAIVEFDFLDGFFLIGIGRTDFQTAGGQYATDTLEFVTCHDGGTLQGSLQLFTRKCEFVFVAFWNNTGVIGTCLPPVSK